MNISKRDNISGKLSIWGLNCFFAFTDGYCLKITPETDTSELFEAKCKELRGCFEHIGWIHGTDDWGRDIAFFASEQQGPFCYHLGTLSLIVDIILETSNPKNENGEYIHDYKDLTGFNAIDFIGESVDSVFSPKQVIKSSGENKNSIEWLDYTDFAKEYSVILNGIECKLIFTVGVERHGHDLDNTDLGKVSAILRLEFIDRQPVDMIEICWQSVCAFLTFCIGQYNVSDLKICLWDENHRIGNHGYQGLIDCFINNEKVENVHLAFPPYYRLQIASLGEKAGQIFSLISSEETRPILGFLPRNNSDFAVDRNKIRDLCTSFEVEYELNGEKLSNDNVKALVESLKHTVKEYKKENPDVIQERTYSYIFSSLGFISLPATDKVAFIYKKYSAIIDDHYMRSGLSSGFNIKVDEDQTCQDIAWIVKARNSITHATGIADAQIPNAIYARLKTAVLCSVLERAGYCIEEITAIMKDYFQGMN